MKEAIEQVTRGDRFRQIRTMAGFRRQKDLALELYGDENKDQYVSRVEADKARFVDGDYALAVARACAGRAQLAHMDIPSVLMYLIEGEGWELHPRFAARGDDAAGEVSTRWFTQTSSDLEREAA